jgi:hypothetical protein
MLGGPRMRVIPRLVILLIVVGVGSTISATSQIGEPPPPSQCILGTVLTLTVTPDEVDWHQSATLQWSGAPSCLPIV